MMKSTKRHQMSASNNWLQIPDELHERIFALLPVSTIVQARGVCRQWRSILCSPSFLEHWSRVAAPIPWFLMFRNHKFRAYNPSLSLWQDIPVSSQIDLTCIVASAGGLLFLSSQRKKKGSLPLLLVCNPLTMSCRILPKPSTITRIHIMGMLARDGAYEILVTGLTGAGSKQELVTELYNSSLGEWRVQGSSKVDLFQDFSGMRAVFCAGHFYCLSVPPYKLLAYSIEDRVWIQLRVQPPMGSLSSASLFVCQERLMMAGKVMQGNNLKEVRIWELTTLPSSSPTSPSSQIRGEIINLARHNSVVREFCKCLTYFMALQRSKGLDSICFNSWCRWRTLMYDVSHKTWNWLPEHCGRFKDMLSGLTYEPTFLAKA